MRDTVSDTMNIVGLTHLDVQLTQHAVALSLELVSFLVQIKKFFFINRIQILTCNTACKDLIGRNLH